MNRILIFAFVIFLIIIGVLLFILYRGTFPRIPATQLPQQSIPQIQPSNLNTYQGRIVQINPFGSDKLEIILDIETPTILVSRDTGVAKLSENGQVERVLTAEELKSGNNVEISMEYDSETQTYSLYAIYLR